MIDLSGVNPGMDVYSSDGHKIGTVEAVQTTEIGGSGLDTGGITAVDAGTTPNTYVKVARHGLLRSQPPLYVPVTQVESVAPEKRITLACARDACEEKYEMVPPGLSA